jgi:hypothetical protein
MLGFRISGTVFKPSATVMTFSLGAIPLTGNDLCFVKGAEVPQSKRFSPSLGH